MEKTFFLLLTHFIIIFSLLLPCFPPENVCVLYSMDGFNGTQVNREEQEGMTMMTKKNCYHISCSYDDIM